MCRVVFTSFYFRKKDFIPKCCLQNLGGRDHRLIEVTVLRCPETLRSTTKEPLSR